MKNMLCNFLKAVYLIFLHWNMIGFSHESGNRTVSIQFLTIIDRGLCITLLQMLVILTEISS